MSHLQKPNEEKSNAKGLRQTSNSDVNKAPAMTARRG